MREFRQYAISLSWVLNKLYLRGIPPIKNLQKPFQSINCLDSLLILVNVHRFQVTFRSDGTMMCAKLSTTVSHSIFFSMKCRWVNVNEIWSLLMLMDLLHMLIWSINVKAEHTAAQMNKDALILPLYLRYQVILNPLAQPQDLYLHRHLHLSLPMPWLSLCWSWWFRVFTLFQSWFVSSIFPLCIWYCSVSNTHNKLRFEENIFDW